MKEHTFMRFFPAACLDKSFFFRLTARTHKADHTSGVHIVVDMMRASLGKSPHGGSPRRSGRAPAPMSTSLGSHTG